MKFVFFLIFLLIANIFYCFLKKDYENFNEFNSNIDLFDRELFECQVVRIS